MCSKQHMQEAINKGKLVGLSPNWKDGRWFTQGGLGKGAFNILGEKKLVVVMPEVRLSYLIMREAHEEIHQCAKKIFLLKYKNKVKSDYQYNRISEVFPDGEGQSLRNLIDLLTESRGGLNIESRF